MLEHSPQARRGRPLKFGRPARPVTLTLPEDAIVALHAIDGDIGRAIVQLLGNPTRPTTEPPAVELSWFGRRAVIVVRPLKALKGLAGIELVPFGDPGRALISFTERMTIPQFELRVQDALETSTLSALERAALTELGDILKETRRAGAISLSERSIIVLDRQPRHADRTRRRTG